MTPPAPLEPPTGPRRAEDLLERARRVLPQDWPFGAVWAVRHADGVYPHFAVRVDGARFWDAAGHEYLDWYLGGGVATLGHRHPAVQRAMEQQLARGVHLSLPSELEVEVAERIVALFPGCEQVAFGKNGNDVTSAAVRLARARTGRERVVISGYHGWQDWSKAGAADAAGIPVALHALVHEIPNNDPGAARAWMARHGGEVAAIVVEPVRYADPSPDFLRTLRALADEHGALLVFDEIVTGLRVARGGAQELAGVRPDLTCLAKSIANGLPLAALAGPRRLMQHLPSIFFSLTFSREALALAAARATLDVHRDHDVAGHLARIGERLRAGFGRLAAQAGLAWSLDGHPAMLHLHLEGAGRLTTRGAEALFVEGCQRRGVYVQIHRLLPSFAHTDADVERTLAVMGEAMAEVRRAMEDGLEGKLDAPIWKSFQTAASAVAPTFRRVELLGAGARLVLERGDARVPVRVGVEPAEPVEPDATVRARYRITDWNPGNAVVSVVLAAWSEVAGHFCEVRHEASLGQAAASNASLGDRFVRAPCAYDARAGVLKIRIGADSLSASHTTTEVTELGSLATTRRKWRIACFIEAVGPSGPVTVELEELRVDRD